VESVLQKLRKITGIPEQITVKIEGGEHYFTGAKKGSG